MEQTDDTEKIILSKLKENLRGFTIKQIVEATGFSRETVTRHIRALEYQNEVYLVRFGNVDVYCSNHRKFPDRDTQKIVLRGRTIFINRLENEYGELIKISETRKKGDKWEPKGSVIFNPSDLPKIIEALTKVLERPQILKKDEENSN